MKTTTDALLGVPRDASTKDVKVPPLLAGGPISFNIYVQNENNFEFPVARIEMAIYYFSVS